MWGKILTFPQSNFEIMPRIITYKIVFIRGDVRPLNMAYLAPQLRQSERLLLLQQQNKVLVHRPLNWG